MQEQAALGTKATLLHVLHPIMRESYQHIYDTRYNNIYVHQCVSISNLQPVWTNLYKYMAYAKGSLKAGNNSRFVMKHKLPSHDII